jgi:hypothetical protein
MPVTLPTVGSLNWGDGLNAAITALSNARDAAHLTTVAMGTDTISFVAANTASKVITFPAGRFATTPVVMAIVAAGSINWIPSTGSVNANNFTLFVFRRDGTIQTTSFAVQWLAVLAT